MDLRLGTPPQPLNFTLVVDSGFSWVACSSSCAINCTTASLFQPAFSAISTSCGPSSPCSYNTSYATNFSSADDLHTFRGKLVIGNYKLRNASISSSMAYTSMITNPQAAELYFINLATISIDNNKFQLVQAIRNYTTNLVEVSSSIANALGLELCHNITFLHQQPLSYHFLGGAGARIEVPPWFLLDDSGNVNNTICMAIGLSDSVGLYLNVIGTYQQLDLTVEYDLEHFLLTI
ncbi:hypothetical protein SELMODRAFT_413679 [Selaginella moellendorffii]|uniref:Xylanase inhibitor C-terminal domain-containing protein n=1 Tax=Selaginella moellendorffii TaxID=88036 RepID=D8RPV7_SELML|nr:hypothetical protein SELMODRAFT_413679 [Selaginella moellendorffii]